MNRWLKLLLLVVTAVIVTQLLVQRAAPPSSTGDRAPPLALPDLNGRHVDLARLRGKVVAVNFWATWCSPCRDEIPELAQFWTEQKGRCFELVGVAEESAREDVAKVAASIPYPVVVDERAEALGAWGHLPAAARGRGEAAPAGDLSRELTREQTSRGARGGARSRAWPAPAHRARSAASP
jgi:cytochrome c biogenesis protein CcmG/thiol:disulfide interchange protein DsbE